MWGVGGQIGKERHTQETITKLHSHLLVLQADGLTMGLVAKVLCPAFTIARYI